MRTIEDINKKALDTLSIDHIIHGEIMNEIIEIQDQMENPLSSHHMPYLNGKLDALVGVYSLLNDIIWHKEKLDRKDI